MEWTTMSFPELHGSIEHDYVLGSQHQYLKLGWNGRESHLSLVPAGLSGDIILTSKHYGTTDRQQLITVILVIDYLYRF